MQILPLFSNVSISFLIVVKFGGSGKEKTEDCYFAKLEARTEMRMKEMYWTKFRVCISISSQIIPVSDIIMNIYFLR